MVHGSGIDQTGLKCCVLALRTSWTTYQCQLLKLKFIMFIMYGGILSLTHSHLYHYWHIPTMVGFCHGGNMLGNHDDNDNGNNDGNDDGRWQLWLLPDSKGPWWRGWWRGQGCRSATSLACRRNHEICRRSHHFEDQTILQINQSDAQCEKVTLEVFQRWLESACSKQTKQTQPFDSNYQLINVR